MKNLFLITVLLVLCNAYSQDIIHRKQCYSTADFIDPATEKIIKTETHSEVCVKFLSSQRVTIWVENNEFKLDFTSVEFLELNENNSSIFRGIGFIGSIKFEIIYITAEDINYHVALILMHNVPVEELTNKVILQYKART